jgi:hypothetical protein
VTLRTNPCFEIVEVVREDEGFKDVVISSQTACKEVIAHNSNAEGSFENQRTWSPQVVYEAALKIRIETG